MSSTPGRIRDVPAGRTVRGVAAAPPSKSHAIRLLLAAALADGISAVAALPDAGDVSAVRRALEALGIRTEAHADALRVHGCAGRLPAVGDAPVHVDLGGSGTGLRLLAAACCLGRGPYVLDGDASLRARPEGGVVDVVARLGCRAEAGSGRPPLRISGGPLGRLAGELACPAVGTSSQPLSGLLLTAAAAGGDVTVRVPARGASLGYVDLTLGVLARFGAAVDVTADAVRGDRVVRIRGDGLRACDERVEGDWSSGAYLLAAGAVAGGPVRVCGLHVGARQPDVRVLQVLRAFGARCEVEGDAVVCRAGDALTGITVDLGDAPDLAPLVGALGCVATGTTRVTGAPHLRHKESDRIASVVAAARALGADAEERDDGFVVHGGGARGGLVDPRGDHRIALAFAVAGLALPGVRIADPECVAKSFPGFWDVLDTLLDPA